MPELDGLLDERYPADVWVIIREQLEAIERGDPNAERELAQVRFESKVRGRLIRGSPARTRSLVETPTKPTPALPIVGAISGAILIGMGWLLGGGLVMLGAIAFALFILVVAVSGSRLAHDRDSAPRDGHDVERLAAPDDVRELAARISQSRP